MAKKRITLPKGFEELLKNGSIEELKVIFDKCEIDARGGYAKQTALAFDEYPRELACWLRKVPIYKPKILPAWRSWE